MLGPYNTRVSPYFYCYCSPLLLFLFPCSPHIDIIVPHNSPLLLLLCPYIIIVRSARIILWPHELLYIKMRLFHLNHPRIVHLCNLKVVSPSKRLISKSLIYLFFYFVRWFHNSEGEGGLTFGFTWLIFGLVFPWDPTFMLGICHRGDWPK